MSGWQEKAREVLARRLYLRQAGMFIHPDDVDTPEERWEAGHAPRRAWLSAADALLPDLAPVVEAEVRRGQAEALRAIGDDLASVTHGKTSEGLSHWPHHDQGIYELAIEEASVQIHDRADAIEAGDPR